MMAKDEDKPPGGFVILEGQPGEFRVTGHEASYVIEASAAASRSLFTASSTATATGHPDIADAAQKANTTIQNVFHISVSNGGQVVVNQPVELTINQQSITEIQNVTENYERVLQENNIPFFDCKDCLDECIAKAPSSTAKLHCRVLYMGCLANKTMSVFKPFAD